MAHHVETMAYANQLPWHGLGTRVDDTIDCDEMLIKAGLDWDVVKRPLTFPNPDGTFSEIKGQNALVRDTDGQFMTICSNKWKPVQNRELMEGIRSFVEGGGAKLETAGSLRDGKTIWVLAKIAYDFEVTAGDKVHGYLLITGHHQVGKATTVRSTYVRVVCANTMAYANYKGMGKDLYRQNHCSEFDAVNAKEMVLENIEFLRAVEARSKKIQLLKIGMEDALKKVILPVFKPELEINNILDINDDKVLGRQVREIRNSIMNSPGATPGNGWGILNGVTHWTDHVAGRSPKTRLESAWYGPNSDKKLKIEEKLLQLC